MSHHRELKAAASKVIETAVTYIERERSVELLNSVAREAALADVEDAHMRLVWAVDEYKKLAAVTDTPGASSGRRTSIAAGHNLSAVSTWRGRVQREVWRAGLVRTVEQPADFPEHRGGLTCDELERKLGQHGRSAPHQSVSSAVNWAEQAGWIKDSGKTRLTRQGQRAIIYEPTVMLIDRMREEVRVG